MLKLATTGNYPEVFQTHKTDFVLTENEILQYKKLSGFFRKKGWILKRLILKELAATYLNNYKELWFPFNTLDINKKNDFNTFTITATMHNNKEPVFTGSANICNNYGVGHIIEYIPNLMVGIKIDVIKQEYPFSMDSSFYKIEEKYIKSKNQYETNKYITIFSLFKKIMKEWNIKNDKIPEIVEVNADDTIEINFKKVNLKGIDDYLVKFWEFEDFIITFTSFFKKEQRFSIENSISNWI